MDNKENFDEEIYTLTDEEGNEGQYALLGEIENDKKIYLALVPLTEGKNDEYVILRLELDENGEETLVTIDDDEEFDTVADIVEDQLFNEIDYDEN